MAGAAEPHAPQSARAGQRGDLGAGPDGDAGVLVDPVGQVPRHGGLQRLTADDDVNLGTAAAEEQGGLTGGVAAADDGDRAGAAGLGLGLGGRVVHPTPSNSASRSSGSRLYWAPVAMMTDLAATVSPSSKLTWCRPSADDKDMARAACLIRTPNFCACSVARAASSSPDRPAGKPRRFSIRDVVPAWPPSAVSSAGPWPALRTRRRPRPRGPPAHHQQVAHPGGIGSFRARDAHASSRARPLGSSAAARRG